MPAGVGRVHARAAWIEMINCTITGLSSLCAQLMLFMVIYDRRTAPESPEDAMSEAAREAITGWMKIASSLARDFEMDAVSERIALIREAIDRGLTYRRAATELRVLLETIHAGTSGHLLYRYPGRQRDAIEDWGEDWKPVLDAFPSADGDISAGVDLWALQHPTASVSQFMRVLERGLRALAQDVGVDFGPQSWGVVVDQIESQIRELRRTLPRGAAKNERLKFLSEAAKEFVYFKDGWRNHAAHAHGTYTMGQARVVMDHVRSFMTVLATRLDEVDAGT